MCGALLGLKLWWILFFIAVTRERSVVNTGCLDVQYLKFQFPFCVALVTDSSIFSENVFYLEQGRVTG